MIDKLKHERGGVLLLVALSLILLIGLLALAIDIGVGYAARRKVQNAVDAGALAAATKLAEHTSDAAIYAIIEQYTTVENEAQTFEAFYIAEPGGPTLAAVGGGSIPAQATGVRVNATLTTPTYFARLMGFDTLTVEATGGGGFGKADIMLVIDRSGSMAFDGNNPQQPMTKTKDAAKAFVELNNPLLTNIGVVSYASDHRLDYSLSPNFASVKSAIHGLTASGCTNSRGGLYRAKNELLTSGRPGAIRVIVFLTDGLPNYGINSSGGSVALCSSCPNHCLAAQNALITEAQLVAGEAIVVYTIALGNTTIVPAPAGMRSGWELMQEVAAITGGEAFYAPTANDLGAVYQAIFERIRLRLIE